MSECEKKEAAREIINTWSYHAGRLDAEAMGKLLSENCEVEGLVEIVGGKGPLIGRRQVVEMLGSAFPHFKWITQSNTIVSVTLDSTGTIATTRTNLVERAGPKARPNLFILVAVYDDVLKLTGEGWRFAKRTITAHDMQEFPAAVKRSL
jgi:hypothetical protein